MKKLIFSMLFVALVTFFSANARATCPIGYTPITITTYSYDGCPIEIHYCLKNIGYGISYIYLDEISIDVSDPDCFGITLDETFWRSIDNAIYLNANSLITFPPCTTGSNVNFEVTKAVCWDLVTDEEEMVVRLVPCDEEPGSCVVMYWVCWENGILTRTQVDEPEIFGSECGSEPLLLLPPYDFPCFNSCY